MSTLNTTFKGIQSLRLIFFYIESCQYSMFILIAVEIFHNIIRKQPRTKEICRCFIFLNPVKNPMFTRTIFIWPDDLIRESVCACEKLFVDEESTWHKSNHGRTKTLTKTTQKGGFSKLCVKIKKRCYTDLLHFSTRKHNLVSFFGRIIF